MDLFKGWIDEHFMPHGHCYFWQPDVLWTNVLGDGLTAASYFAIPFLLFVFLRRRPDVQYSTIFGAFALFILACGLTHVFTIVSVWSPIYRVEGILKLITAGVSCGTVVLLYRQFPEILRIPTNQQLSQANAALQVEINQHRSTLRELRQKEGTLQTIIRDAPVGMALLDANGTFYQVNEAFCQLLGHHESYLLGAPHEKITYPEDLAIDQHYNRLFLEKKVNSAKWEKRYLTKSGALKWVLLHASVVRDAQGEIEHYIAQVADIDEQKRSGEAIAKRSEELEAAVRLRTRELEEATLDLENFVYATTHDLRAPLINITGLTQVLREELHHLPNTSQEINRILSMITYDTRRLDNLISDLLVFSRASRQDMKQEELDMVAIIQIALSRLLPKYDHREVIIELPPLAKGYGDPTALEIVWINLISNALKYAKDEGPIELRFQSTLQDHKSIFRLSDNGLGFDSERYRSRLFKLFQRLHPDTNREGTGMGLAVVARILRKHGGQIWAKSQPGRGAEFSFSLPISSTETKLNERLFPEKTVESISA